MTLDEWKQEFLRVVSTKDIQRGYDDEDFPFYKINHPYQKTMYSKNFSYEDMCRLEDWVSAWCVDNYGIQPT